MEYLLYVCNNCRNLHAVTDDQVGDCAVCGGHDTEAVYIDEFQ